MREEADESGALDGVYSSVFAETGERPSSRKAIGRVLNADSCVEAQILRGTKPGAVPSPRSRVMHHAVYNSRIAGMLTLLSSPLVRSLLPVLVMLLNVMAYAQNWAGAEEQLAGKIVSTTGPRTMAVEVSNRSSLSTASADEIRRRLLTGLAALGARFVNAEQAAATVHISLSEDLESYVWIAEIRQGSNDRSVVMVSLLRSGIQPIEPEATAMVLHKTPLWWQRERILDLAVVESNPTHMIVLDSNGVVSYRLQDNRWQPEQSLTVTHSRPWPRDLRGRLMLRKDHFFDAYLPGVFCRSTAGTPLAMTCYDGDTWPVGTDRFSLNASFTASRNFFSGVLSPGVGKQTTTPAFYSAAVLPRDQYTLWLFAAVDGQVHLLDSITDRAVGKLGWGSSIAAVRSGCGSGWQVLATGMGDGPSDAVRAFEVRDHEPIAASPRLELNGSITALWTESGEASVLSVVRNSEASRYEVYRLTLTCGR